MRPVLTICIVFVHTQVSLFNSCGVQFLQKASLQSLCSLHTQAVMPIIHVWCAIVVTVYMYMKDKFYRAQLP